MPVSGCIEHDFTIHTYIRQARRKSRDIYIVSYDFKDAFGALDHSIIRQAINGLGFIEIAQRQIMSMYEDIGFWVESTEGCTPIIPQKHGVKQGDPSSPLIFNLFLEYLSRKLNRITTTPNIPTKHLLLADNLITIADNPSTCQALHEEVVEFCHMTGIEIQARKCHLLANQAAGKVKRTVDRSLKLTIQDIDIPTIKARDSFKYLGNKVGMQRNGIYGQFHEMLKDTETVLMKVADSPLRIHQKHHAIRTFVIPKWEYFVQLNGLGVHHAKLLGQALRTAIRKYCKLPTHASMAFFHTDRENGGLGMPDPWTWACSTQAVHVAELLNSKDPTVRKLVVDSIRSIIEARYPGVPHTMEEHTLVMSYLGGSLEHLKQGNYIDCFDLIAHVPRAIKATRMKITYHTYKGYEVVPNNPPQVAENQPGTEREIKWPRTLTKVARVKAACRQHIAEHWASQPQQGHALATLRNPHSNAWLTNSDLYPAAYRFAVKARLDLLPHNRNKQRWKQRDTADCPHCGRMETTHHILSVCPRYRPIRTERHDKIAERLARTARYNHPDCEVFVNQSPPDIQADQLRPDLVIVNRTLKQVKILDVAVTAQCDDQCLNEKREEKVTKYTAINQQYEDLGFSTRLDAVVFGDLGGSDTRNTTIFTQILKSPRSYADKMHRFIVADILRAGQRIWAQRSNLSLPAVNNNRYIADSRDTARNVAPTTQDIVQATPVTQINRLIEDIRHGRE
ncbi:uncharacterized protein VTP21DRAFT_6911 [Calcarisporiella thermophila]|uniref:uncharacterized protein n=1 Tax=Calcarisporiella thermophila TaxID=911321 RepID=UPI0037426FBE